MDRIKVAIFFVFVSIVSLVAVSSSVKAQSVGTVFINADGSVSGTKAIQHSGNHYTLTESLYNSSIVVLCNNIILDGGGFTLQGPEEWPTPAGINLTCTGVTVKNFVVKYWEVGILGAYDGNVISNNSIVGNERDIAIYADNYRVVGNYIGQGDYCVRVVGDNDVFYRNTIDNWGFAFWITDSSGIIIADNSITSNNPMVFSTDYGGFQVYHNNFYNMRYNTNILTANANATEATLLPWDNGYPSGGNYWSDYSNNYPNATEIDNSGIYNTPYNVSTYYVGTSPIVHAQNVLDRYPLLSPVNISNATLELPLANPSPTPSSSPTSTPTAKPNNTQKSTPPEQAAVTVVGVLVVVIVIILAVFLLLNKRSKTQSENPQFTR